MKRFILCLCFAPALSLTLTAADWSQFKGPNASGVSSETNLPLKWGKDDGVKWKTPLPARGVSSPVVAGDRVYVTCSSGTRDDRLHVLCFDAATGQKLWHRTLQATGGTGCHPKSCMAAPTPVADATGVYALFATADVVAFDKDGTLRWYRSLVGDYPAISNQVGMASSPVLIKDRLVIPMDNQGDSFLAAVDTKYGKNVWKAPRPRESNWVTPLVRTVGDKTEVMFSGQSGMAAYDAATGEKRWTSKAGRGSIPTSALDGDTLYMPLSGTTAVKLGPEGIEGEPKWKSNGIQSGMASPLFYAGKVYATSGQGFIACADAKTGKELYKERTKGAYSASAIAGDGKVYCTNETGITTVIDAKSETFEVLATNDIGEEVLGTPAIAGGCLFIRTDKHLWCVGK